MPRHLDQGGRLYPYLLRVKIVILRSEEDEESLSRELMKKLTPAVLSKLRRCFKKAKDKNAAAMAVDR